MKWAALLGLALAWLAMVAPGLAECSIAPLFAAHRGGSLLWPENSMVAFRGAIELGADYLELDVHLSSDGEVIVIHDPTLDRTTTGGGPIREQPLAALKALRLRDRRGAPTEEAIPELSEVVALASAARRRLLLEIKVDERGRRYPGIEEKVFGVLDRHGMVGSTVLMAFEPETWRRVRALRPDAMAGALYSRGTLRSLRSSLARELEAARAAGVGFIGLQHSLVDVGAVAATRAAGLTLAVWTVNEPDAIRRFVHANVDIVITDRPDLAKALLGR
jgi:glycerophosphoryl diester phosphodiesterase